MNEVFSSVLRGSPSDDWLSLAWSINLLLIFISIVLAVIARFASSWYYAILQIMAAMSWSVWGLAGMWFTYCFVSPRLAEGGLLRDITAHHPNELGPNAVAIFGGIMGAYFIVDKSRELLRRG